MSVKKISIIVPTWNEEGNIRELVERIHKTLAANQISYHLVFVDDHSTDKTQSLIKNLANNYPIELHIKKGLQGKAQSLLEGFAFAKYELLCMIDADLQYPPEAIPSMIAKVESGADIIVANRSVVHTSIIRKVISKGFMYVFARLIHGFDFDVQSGLKVFKKECMNGLEFDPSPWAFDMEFLKKNIDRGYSVDTVNINFEKRVRGKTKINLVKASWEIGVHAIKLKFSSNKIVHHVPELHYRESA